jgi:hypothetical protein
LSLPHPDAPRLREEGTIEMIDNLRGFLESSPED